MFVDVGKGVVFKEVRYAICEFPIYRVSATISSLPHESSHVVVGLRVWLADLHRRHFVWGSNDRVKRELGIRGGGFVEEAMSGPECPPLIVLGSPNKQFRVSYPSSLRDCLTWPYVGALEQPSLAFCTFSFAASRLQ